MKTLTPWDAFLSIFSGFDISDFFWIIIGIGCVFMFYRLAVQRKQRYQYSWRNVMFWIIASIGWFFVFYMVAFRKISEGGSLPILFLTISGFSSAITIIFLTKRTKLWEKIISGSLISVIGFGILAAFGTDNKAIGYALGMGLVGGAIVGQIFSTTKAMYQKLRGSIDEVIEEEMEKQREMEGATDKSDSDNWINRARKI